MAWTAEDRSRAMVVLAAHNGHAGLAVKVLREQHGMKGVQPADVRQWRNSTCRDEYERIVADQPDASAALINDTLEIVRLAAMAERLAVEKAYSEIAAGECKDPAKAARDLAHIKAVNVEKYLNLSGRPTQIVEFQTPDEMLASLIRDKVFLPAGDGEDGVIELPPEAVVELPA